MLEYQLIDGNRNALRRSYFQILAAQNAKVLRRCCSSETYQRIQRLQITAADSLELSIIIQREVLRRRGTGKTTAISIAEMLDGNNRASVNALIESDIARYSLGKRASVDCLVEGGVVAVLVRPEMFHLRHLIAEFLMRAGYKSEFGAPRTIGIEKYLALYNHAIGDPEKEPHVRRRAFGYIHKPLYLWLITDPYRPNVSAVDVLCRNYRGTAGVMAPGTLRGDTVYQEMCLADVNDHELAILALDPIQEFTNAGGRFSAPVRDGFFANIAGVHIPNADEIRKDLCVLLEPGEAESILAKRLRRNVVKALALRRQLLGAVPA